LGAMMRPQVTGITSDQRGTCALGAALEAVGRANNPEEGWMPIYDIWPVTRETVSYPGERHHGERMLVGSCCWILNDADHWTRERIADFVAGVEDTLSTAVTLQPAVDAVGEAPVQPVAMAAR